MIQRCCPPLTRAALVPLVLGVAGCADRSPTAADPSPAPAVASAATSAKAPVSEVAVVDPRAAAASAVHDVLARVLPTLDGGPELTALRAACDDLARAVEAGPTGGGREIAAATARAGALLDALARRVAHDPGAAAELDAVRLTLDRTAQLAP